MIDANTLNYVLLCYNVIHGNVFLFPLHIKTTSSPPWFQI